jgi:hypothetical protein
VFFARMLPIIRTFISLPAGVARMPFWRFTALTLAGCVPWVLMLALIGRSVGDNWEEWRDHLHYLDYAVVAGAIALIVYLIIKRRRGGGPDDPEAAEGAPPSPSRPARAALELPGPRRIHRRSDPDRARGGAGHRPGAGGAAAGLELGPHRAGAVARRLGLGADRSRGA